MEAVPPRRVEVIYGLVGVKFHLQVLTVWLEPRIVGAVDVDIVIVVVSRVTIPANKALVCRDGEVVVRAIRTEIPAVLPWMLIGTRTLIPEAAVRLSKG